MKFQTKTILAALATCLASSAMAQSSVTMYGILDAGVQINYAGSGKQIKMVSGIADGSRIGFKGTEDMGGGYKAIFNLEARVELDTGSNKAGNISDYQGYALTKGMNFPTFGNPALVGAANQTLASLRSALQPKYVVNSTNPYVVARGGGPEGGLFDRTAYVGMITPVGAVLMGRMYTPAYEICAMGDTFEAGTAGSWGNNLIIGRGGLLTAGIAIRSNKSLQYRMELPNGFGAALMYGFQNSGYVGLDKRFIAGNVKYKARGLDVGLGYNRGVNTDGTTGLVSFSAAGSYATGDFKFFGGYESMKNENSILLPVFNDVWDLEAAKTLKASGVPDAVLAAWTTVFKTNIAKNFKLDADTYTLGMHYKIGNGRIMTSFSILNDKTLSNSDAKQFAIGYDYNLSPRTDIYSVFGMIKNQNEGQYALGAASAPGGFTEKMGQTARAIQIGVRHRF